MELPKQETTSPGTGDSSWWSGKANPDSTGDAAIALGHLPQYPSCLFHKKEQ